MRAGARLVLARRAVAADPYSAFAHLVLARAARHNNGCQMAIRSARRAMVLNPDDPDLHAIAGTQLYYCGDPGAEAAARRAIALDPSPPASFYAPLVFLALDRGDITGAKQLTQQMMPGPNAAPGFYDMIFAVVAGGVGRRAGGKGGMDANGERRSHPVRAIPRRSSVAGRCPSMSRKKASAICAMRV